jgi:Tol biopolymer transport system component
MVKMILVLVVAVLIVIQGLVSCAPDIQTPTPVAVDNQTVKPQSTDADDNKTVQTPPDISAQENIEILDAADTQLLLQHVGQKVRVKGNVIKFYTVYDDNRRPLMLFFTDWDLSYDDWQKSQAGTFFKAMLYKENNFKFPAIDECYQQDVVVEGTIELFKSAPVIILKNTEQLRLVNKQPVKINLPENLKDTKILFVSDRDSFVDPLQWGYDGQGEIYTMNADGSNTIQLKDSGGRNRCPTWSPDGSKIVFMSDRDSIIEWAWDIFVMNADGSNVTRLTKNHARNLNPRWSPDGTKITFASDFGATNLLQIFTMNADGSDIRQVTFTRRPSSCYGPCFTVDGKEIIFVSNQEGSWAIYKVDLAAGTNITNLTQIDNKEVAWPIVSPDGKKIVYYQNVSKRIDLMNPDYKLFIMSIDGTDSKRISFIPYSQYEEMVISDYYPAWSPDGSKIIFTSNRSTGLWQRNSTTVRRLWVSQTYVMDVDGSNMYRMPYVWGNNWFPSWK